MTPHNMIFAGFGGQGVLFTGKVVAYAGLIDGHEVSWLPSYGPEMRGGTANCSVCLSGEAIGSPMVTEPDVLVVFNGPSYDKFIDSVIPGGSVFLDSTLIDRTCTRTDINLFSVPASQLAVDEHLEGIANVILLGKVMKEVPFASFATIEKALQKCIPPRKSHLLEHNIRAIRLGMSL